MASEHGTNSGYTHGCRCRLCTIAHSDHHREYRKEQRRLARLGREVERMVKAGRKRV